MIAWLLNGYKCHGSDTTIMDIKVAAVTVAYIYGLASWIITDNAHVTSGYLQLVILKGDGNYNLLAFLSYRLELSGRVVLEWFTVLIDVLNNSYA